MILSGPYLPPVSGKKPKSVVIILHGYGADGENLIDIASFMASHFPDTYFIAPNAPKPCEMGGGGYQWFSLADRAPEKMLAGLQAITPTLNQLIDEVLAETGLTEDKLVLLGFSQGTMSALHVGPRREKQLAAIVGFSGALLAPELLAETKTKPPICLIHGEQDDVVPFAAMGAAEKELKASDFKIETHPRPYLPHSIDPGGIDIAIGFLKSKI